MLYILFGLFSGLLTKLSDDHSEKENKNKIKSIIYGIIVGVMIWLGAVYEPLLFSLVLGVVIGNVFAGKIDRLEHIITLIVLFGLSYYFNYINLETIDLKILFIFMFGAFFDEVIHGLKVKGRVRWLSENRLICPIIALLLTPISIVYLIYLIAFDIGYRIAERINFIK